MNSLFTDHRTRLNGNGSSLVQHRESSNFPQNSLHHWNRIAAHKCQCIRSVHLECAARRRLSTSGGARFGLHDTGHLPFAHTVVAVQEGEA